MKLLFIFLISLLLVSCSTNSNVYDARLDQFQNPSEKQSRAVSSVSTKKLKLKKFLWKKRLLVVCDQSEKQQFNSKLKKEYLINNKGNSERKLEIISGCSFEAGSLKSNEAALIGLDGGIKAKYQKPISMKSIYELIDQMPMRINEIEGK